MLHVLQYFEGTSIADVFDSADLIMVHSIVAGAGRKGSSFSLGGGN